MRYNYYKSFFETAKKRSKILTPRYKYFFFNVNVELKKMV